MEHTTATTSHYDKAAKYYDVFNEERSKPINMAIERILKQHQVTNVLDFACGTGLQVFWLAQSGFQVSGIDINNKMLEIAHNKVLSHLLKRIRIFDILKEIVAGNNVESRSKINEVF